MQKQAYDTSDKELLPSPMDVCNARGATNVLLNSINGR